MIHKGKTAMKTRTIILLIAFTLLTAGQLQARYYEQGRRHYSRKEYDKAREMFLKAAESEGSGNAHYFLGEIEKIRGNYREAEEHFTTAISRPNISRQYLINSYWSALVMAEQRHDHESVVVICRSMWQRTGDASARQRIDTLINKLLWSNNEEAIAKYRKGIELKNSGGREAARNAFQGALALDGSFLAPKFELGMASYNAGDLDRAAGYLEAIASRIPFYAEVQLVLADINFRKFNYHGAIGRYDRALEFGFIDPSADYDIRLKRGTSFYNLDDYQGAEKEIDQALIHRPGSVDALLLLSLVKIKMGKYDDALKVLKRANAAEPDNPEVHYQMGSVYFRENDGRHIDHFEKLFSLTEAAKDRPSKYTKVFRILAAHHYESKNYRKAVTVLKSLGGGTTDYETRLLLAKSHYGAKEYDTAIELFEGLSLGSEDRYLLCRAYAAGGRKEKARALLVELSALGDYLARAKLDPVLAPLAREIDKGTTRPEPAPEKERSPVKDTEKTAPPAPEKEIERPGEADGESVKKAE